MELTEWDASARLISYTRELRQAVNKDPYNPAILQRFADIQSDILYMREAAITNNDFLECFMLIARLSAILKMLRKKTGHAEAEKIPGQETTNEKAAYYVLTDLEYFLKERCFKVIEDADDYTISQFNLMDPSGAVVCTYNPVESRVEYPPQVVTPRQTPKELSTARCRSVWERAYSKGLVDKDYQWIGGENKKRAYFVYCFTESLRLGFRWKPFERLWNCSKMAQDFYELTAVHALNLTGIYPDVDRLFGLNGKKKRVSNKPRP